VGVHVYRFHTTAGDRHLAPFARRSSYLPGADSEEVIAHEQAGCRSGRISDELSAISHACLPGV
jgi:hypothetical protein